MDYQEVIERVEAAASLVALPDQKAAQRVLTIARQFEARERAAGSLISNVGDTDLRRELNRHFEILGRRGAKALPVAALARALLADLGGTRRDFAEAIADCDHKLSMFGL